MEDDTLTLDMPQSVDVAELEGFLADEDLPLEDAADERNDESDDDDERDEEGGAAAGATQGEEALDDANIVSLGKKQAKLMGKTVYKRWKKLTKKAAKKDRSHDEKRKHKRGEDVDREDGDRKKDKSSSSKDAKKKKHHDEVPETSKRSEKTKRSRRGGAKDVESGDIGDEAAMQAALAAYLGGADGNPQATSFVPTISKSSRGGKAAGNGPAKLSAAQRQQLHEAEAERLVQCMQEYRIRDENARRVGQPALHRLSITNDVALLCRRTYMHRFLVEKGILDELTNWLYDLKRNELGPLDLRSLALDLLMCFEVRGIRKVKEDDNEEHDEKKAAKRIDDLDAYRGICREDLEGTTLGTAVNLLRTHTLETEQNKKTATQLLQRLSRAFQHRRDDDDEPAASTAEVLWGCKGDPTVAPPFDPVISSSDAFQQRMFQPDPLDPLSYLRCPPRRYHKGYVTNLSHIKVNGRAGDQ